MGGLILHDTRSFLFDVMENDSKWAEVLNARIKIDTSVVPIAARTVLYEMGIITNANSRHGFKQNEMDGNETSSSAIDVKEDSKFVIANALQVLAHVVSKHYKENDALDFGLTVVVSAVSCNVLPFLAILLQTASMIHDVNIYREQYNIIRNYLHTFLDKLARLKQSLVVESNIYWEFMGVMTKSNAKTPRITSAMKGFVESAVNNLCDSENSLYKFFIDKLHTATKENDTTVSIIFEAFHKTLNKLFESIPVTTMNKNLWEMYLNRQ